MTATSTAARPAAARKPIAWRMLLRQIHTWIGVFIAPSVLFFALTGALQLFSLHEAHGAYRPPPLVVRLSLLHKDQVFNFPPQKQRLATAAKAAKPAAPPKDKTQDWPLSAVALKWFSLAVAGGLMVSTSLGLWIAFTQGRNKPLLWGLLAAGAALPVLLLQL